MSWPDDLGKNLPIKDLYDDLVKPAAREVGTALGNVAKVARFVLAPIDYLAAQHERWNRYLERVAQKVPEEMWIKAHPQLAGLALEGERRKNNLVIRLYLDSHHCGLRQPKLTRCWKGASQKAQCLSPETSGAEEPPCRYSITPLHNSTRRALCLAHS